MVFLNEFFEKDEFGKNSAHHKLHEKVPSMQRVKLTNSKVNLGLIEWRLNTCNFVCGTMSHAKSLLHWSVTHYQVTLGSGVWK